MPCLLFDLDGVFYVGDTAITGGARTIRWVIDHGIPHLFLTNTTSRPRSALVEKLSGFGIDVDPDRILTPAVAAVRWIEDHINGNIALLVPDATKAEFSNLSQVDIDSAEPIKAIVIGDLGKSWTFEILNTAFKQLMCQPSPVLIALGMTRYWKSSEGLQLDVAPFVTALQYASGVEPVVLGKPAKPFFDTAVSVLLCTAGETLMIGDDIRGDIGGAQSTGINGVLVKTGKFQPADLSTDIQPFDIIGTIDDLPQQWESLCARLG